MEEEKLFVKRWKKWLNVTSRKKRGMQREGSCFRGRTEVRGVADLTGCLVLSICVRVGRDLGNKYNQHRR